MHARPDHLQEKATRLLTARTIAAMCLLALCVGGMFALLMQSGGRQREAVQDGDAARLAAIDRAVDGYLRDYADVVSARPAPRSRATRRRITAQGKRRMDALRTLLDRYETHVQDKADRSMAPVGERSRETEVLSSVGLALAVSLILLVALYQLRAVVRPLRRTAELAVDELAAQKAHAERLQAFAARLASEPEIEPLAEAVLEELADVGSAEAGALYVYVEAAGQAALVAVRALDPEQMPVNVRPGEGLAGRALAERRTLTASHETAHEAHVPLLQGERIVGAVTLVRAGEATAFAPAELDTLEQLAERAAASLADAVLLRTVRNQAVLNRAVLDGAADAFVSFDEAGVVLRWNRAAEQMFGIAASAVIGTRGIRDFVEIKGELPMGGSRELDARRADGQAFTVEATISPLKLGERVQFNLFARDVSERKRAEAEADRLKDEFFALVSHELRTPLTSIIGYLELVLEEDRIDAETRRFLEVVERNAGRLLRLVGDLLFAASVEAGTLSLDPATVDLAAVCAESVEAARPKADTAGIALDLDAARVPALHGDPGRLGQAVDNLVSNALKFTPRGGNVAIGLRQDGDEAVLEVRDTGPGIPNGDQAHLFDRFFRSRSAHEQAVPGLGLGLTIVKAIVDGHGGRIDVDSEEGQGAAFIVRLPLAGAPAELPQPDSKHMEVQS